MSSRRKRPRCNKRLRKLRLFAAIPIPDEIRRQLETLRVEIPDVWWLPSSMYHITLQFIGADIDEERLPEIIRTLQNVSVPSFDLTLVGLERYTTPEWSGVIFTNVVEHPALLRLHKDVVSQLEAIGLSLEKDEVYQPHVTLVYVDKSKAESLIESYVADNAGFTSIPFSVREFVLYETVQTSMNSEFIAHAVFPLNG